MNSSVMVSTITTAIADSVEISSRFAISAILSALPLA